MKSLCKKTCHLKAKFFSELSKYSPDDNLKKKIPRTILRLVITAFIASTVLKPKILTEYKILNNENRFFHRIQCIFLTSLKLHLAIIIIRNSNNN